jgi:hypothetical protein
MKQLINRRDAKNRDGAVCGGRYWKPRYSSLFFASGEYHARLFSFEPVAQWGWYAELLETSRMGKRQEQESAQEVTTSGLADLHPGRAFDLRGDGRD